MKVTSSIARKKFWTEELTKWKCFHGGAIGSCSRVNDEGMTFQSDEHIVIQYLKVVKEEPTNVPSTQVLVI